MKTRSILRRLRLPLLSAAFAMGAGEAAGQGTSTPSLSAWTGASSGLWSTSTNWLVTTPPAPAIPFVLPGNGTTNNKIIEFIGGAAGTTIQVNQDIAPGGFNLTQLYLASSTGTFTGTTSGNVRPAPGSTANYEISGGALVFRTGRQIRVDSVASPTFANTPFTPTSSGTIFPGSSIVLASTTGRMVINSAIDISQTTAPLLIQLRTGNDTGASLFINGPIIGAANDIAIQSQSSGELVVVASPNNFTFGGTYNQGTGGNTYLGAINTLWRNVALIADSTSSITAGTNTPAGYGVLEVGYNQQVGSVSGLGQFSVGTNNGPSVVLSGFLGNFDLLEGDGGLAGFNSTAQFALVGGGLQVTGGSNSYQAGLSVRSGEFLISGEEGSITNQIGLNGAGASLYSGGVLRFDNASLYTGTAGQGRFSDSAPIYGAGGRIRMDGNGGLDGGNNPIPTTEALGSLRVQTGVTTLELNNVGAGGAVSLTFAGLDTTQLARGGQLAVVGTGLGGTGTNTSSVTFGGTVNAINGVIPFGMSQTGYISDVINGGVVNPNALLELTAGGSVRALQTTASNSFGSATANVLVDAANVGVSGSANSLTFAGTGAITTTGALTVTSGAIMNNAAAGTISGTGALTSTSRLYLNSSLGNTLSITAPISTTAISKGGFGTVAISSVVTLSDTSPVVAVNSGTLNVTGATFPASTVYQLSKTSTIVGLTTVGGTLRGNGTVVGAVTMGAGSLIGGSSLGSRDLTTNATPGELTVSSTLSFTGGTAAIGAGNTRVRFYLTSSYGGSSFVQGLISAGGLNFTATSAASPVFIQPQSQLLSDYTNGAVYDFDKTKTYKWTILTTAGTITGVNTASDAAGTPLTNILPDGQFFTNDITNTPNFFYVTADANNIYLNFGVPVPEPMLLGAVVVGGLFLVRRRKA